MIGFDVSDKLKLLAIVSNSTVKLSQKCPCDRRLGGHYSETKSKTKLTYIVHCEHKTN